MLRTFAILLVSSALFGSAQAQGLKIGTVNSEIVVQNHKEFKQVESQLNREIEGWQAERAGWEADMERLKKDIEERDRKLAAGQNTLSESKKASMQAETDSLKQDYSTRLSTQATYEQERFNQRRAELLQGVFESVNKSIEEIGEQEGYDLIIDSANGTVVYARNPDDLTSKLLEHLDKK
jgi:Skp family chaperone for outer membrane proteins